MLVLFCISSFEVTCYKKLHDTAWFQVGFKETVRSQGKELRDCLSGEKPLGLQFIFHQTKCSLGLLYKLYILLEMQLQLALKLHFKVSVADCSPKILGLHLAMLTLMPTIKIQRWQFFADIVCLSPSSIDLPNLKIIFLPLSKQLLIHIRTSKAL